MTTSFPLAWPEGWPRTPAARRGRSAPFGTAWDATRRDMYRELQLIGAASCVISSNLELRLDGTPRADQATAGIPDPGAAIYFALRDRQMVMAQDKWMTVRDNLRTLTLAVRYMRGLERHGGAHMLERAFGGFARLPPPGNGAAHPEPIWRAIFKVLGAGFDVLSKADLRAIVEHRYRDEVKRAHADHERMIILNAAVARAREELS